MIHFSGRQQNSYPTPHQHSEYYYPQEEGYSTQYYSHPPEKSSLPSAPPQMNKPIRQEEDEDRTPPLPETEDDNMECMCLLLLYI